MARMWLRCPCSSCLPSLSRTPSEVPSSAASTSWTPSALPLSTPCTQPPRISDARPATPPVCTTTGPATTSTLCFCPTACRTSSAVCRTAVSTCRSEEMPLDMKANISNAASSAGYFSTCPPASIALAAPGALTSGTPTNPVVVNQNNPQPLQTTVLDTKGNPITGMTVEYESTSPTTIPAGSSVTPILAGAASVSAVCQPPNCNSSAYNQIGLFGNGLPITSNSINLTAPGTNSTVLYMASTQSLYVGSRDFTQTGLAQPFLLPYLPNSMVITNDGSTIYMGSSTALMVL